MSGGQVDGGKGLSSLGPFIVAAFDFGTTYSRYGVSFKHDYEKDPTQELDHHRRELDHHRREVDQLKRFPQADRIQREVYRLKWEVDQLKRLFTPKWERDMLKRFRLADRIQRAKDLLKLEEDLLEIKGTMNAMVKDFIILLQEENLFELLSTPKCAHDHLKRQPCYSKWQPCYSKWAQDLLKLKGTVNAMVKDFIILLQEENLYALLSTPKWAQDHLKRQPCYSKWAQDLLKLIADRLKREEDLLKRKQKPQREREMQARIEEELRRLLVPGSFSFLLLMMRIFMVHVYCLDIASTGKKKVRLIYVYEKAAALILWRCGDVEQNPGPPSDTIRAFEKWTISSLLVEFEKRAGNIKSKQANYQTKPKGWNDAFWFGVPSAGSNDERRSMIQGIRCLYQISGFEIPDKFQYPLEKYQTVDKQESKRDLLDWYEDERSHGLVDQCFANISEMWSKECGQKIYPKRGQKNAVAYFARKLSAIPEFLTEVCKNLITDGETFDCADQDGTTVQQTESQTETGSTPSLCSLESASSYTMVADSPTNSLTVPDPSIAIPFQKPDIVQDRFGNGLPQITKRKSEQMTNADLKSSTAKRQHLAETSRHDEQPPTPVASSSELPLQEVDSTALYFLDSFDALKDGNYDVNSPQETGIDLQQFVEDCLKDPALIAQIFKSI